MKLKKLVINISNSWQTENTRLLWDSEGWCNDMASFGNFSTDDQRLHGIKEICVKPILRSLQLPDFVNVLH